MTEKNVVEKAQHWATDILPGWKTRIGMLIALAAPVATMVGYGFDSAVAKEILEQAPIVINGFIGLGVLIMKLGYNAKK